MRNRPVFCAALLLILLRLPVPVTTAAADADKPDVRGDAGKIVKLAADAITISNVNTRRDKSLRVYAITKDTAYETHHTSVRDHRRIPAKFADLKVGEVVHVTFDHRNNSAIMITRETDN